MDAFYPPDNYYGDNYYPNNGYHDNLSEMPRYPPPIGQPFTPEVRANYRPRGHDFANGGPVSNHKNNNYYRRPNNRYPAKKGQYRAQVIDYGFGGPPNGQTVVPINSDEFAGSDSQMSYAMPNASPMTGSATLLPTPQPQAYPNARFYGQRPPAPQPGPPNMSPNRGLLPTPNPKAERFNYSRRPRQQMSYRPSVQLYGQSSSEHSVAVNPQPVPPPMYNRFAPPVQQPNVGQTFTSNINVETDIHTNQRLEESRVKAIVGEGMESRVQNDLRGFYCLFCGLFCNNLVAAERHVVTPKHQRTKIGENFKGIDAKFTIKSGRISETRVALARKEELTKISNVIKNEYYNEGIRLKDGVGSDAYVCESCWLPLDSLAAVNKHLESHKQFTEQLKICSKPLIGLDFIVEYVDPDPAKSRVYECTMCSTWHSTREIINHVCSFGHRTAFIKKIHPSEGLKYTSETPALSLEAGKRALELETLIGRGQHKVRQTSAPVRCLVNSGSSHNKSNDSNSENTTLKQNFKIDLPKPKAEHEKSDLDKLFSVQLTSEPEAQEVTKVISNLTNAILDYHTKDMSPETSEDFRRQLKQNERLKTEF